MAKAKTVIVAPIKGVFGEDVQVGDQVMVVTTGYSHNVSVKKGIYKGYIESNSGRRARVEVEAVRYAWEKPDGTEFVWRQDYNPTTYPQIKPTLKHKTITYIRKATLQLNRIATLK